MRPLTGTPPTPAAEQLPDVGAAGAAPSSPSRWDQHRSASAKSCVTQSRRGREVRDPDAVRPVVPLASPVPPRFAPETGGGGSFCFVLGCVLHTPSGGQGEHGAGPRRVSSKPTLAVKLQENTRFGGKLL